MMQVSDIYKHLQVKATTAQRSSAAFTGCLHVHDGSRCSMASEYQQRHPSVATPAAVLCKGQYVVTGSRCNSRLRREISTSIVRLIPNQWHIGAAYTHH